MTEIMDIPEARAFILHWGEMSSRWGINRSVAQIHALLYLSDEPLNAGQIARVVLARDDVKAEVASEGDGMIDAACRATGTAVLGGDTNFSDHPQFGGTAIGLVEGDPLLTRRGAQPGDLLYGSGPLGAGSAFALERLVAGAAGHFRPLPRLEEGRLLRRFASCAMDTSDGLLAAFDGWQVEQADIDAVWILTAPGTHVPFTLKAVELGKVRKGDRVGLLGIGSGLNCQMAEVVW